MKKNFFLTLMLALVALFSIETATAQAPVDSPEQAITGLLSRIGGNGAADRFEIVIDANLAENGKDVFIIAPGNGKPCIKGNNQLSVATGINWYLNHYAHINLTWNNLTTDLSQVELPVPTQEEKHVSSAAYRYDFNTCTFSYSMAFWTWERWQQEIDWMALHGINAPLNLVGLDVVTRKFLKELGVSESDIDAYIAGPGFIAWFAMNNLEGWGGTIESQGTGVFMQGNPDWWYTRQEQLCRNMLQRMRELGMQPVIPGFSGQVPNCIVNYSIDGFSSGDVVNNGTWAGGYTRPDILKPNTTSYQTFATVYYKHLHEVMGVSELYSIDPFHEGSLPSGVTNATCYPNIMVELDKHFGNVEQSVKDSYKVTKSPSWIIQYWQGVPQSGAFTAMKNAGYASRFIGLDLFADNIYADNAAKWRTDYYDTCPYIYCMLHNFGGRSGLHGRLETTMDGYFQALAKNNNCQGIGATPEGTETNPILYDMLFELPWMSSNPGADAWLAEYAHSRYGVDSKTAPAALEALKNLKKSVWDCRVNQQGTSEAVILARPNWTIGSVSSWSTSAIYWDTQDVLLAADQLYSVKDLVTANGGQDGIANYNYDFIDVVRQAMVDYAAQLLPLINAARGNDAEYTRLYQLYLQLMLDLDTMLSYDENFKLERWTSLARNIADEVDGTTENDRNWLEWNARTQVTVWSKGNTDLHDYSNRCWAGLIKDFHYWRWKQFFENNGNAFSGGWYSGFEYPWTVDFNETYNLAGDYSKVVIPTDMTATEKAAETFGNYFGRVKGATKNYIFPMGVTTNATKSDVIPEVYRGQEVELPLIIGKNVTISSVWVDLNADGNAGNGETLTANGNNVTIPADAVIGKTTAKVTYSDGTIITFNLALIEDITDARTVTAVAGDNGSVAIEGTNELSITTTEAVKITATANTGYNFENWTKDGEVVSNDNPFIYYGKDAATFTANFIQDKWGVPTEDKSDWGDAQVKTSFVNELTFAYYNREPETIYEASVAPDNLFNTIPQIINVPQGASFDVTWSDNGDNGLQFCCLSAYIDLNADGDFTDEGELLKVAGTKGAKNTAVCEGKINVILPYDAPLGLTHMRLRFDGAWKDNGYDATTKSYDAKAQLNRMCYEIVINVTEKSDKAATINVETNSAEWGTVEVWTDETPDGSTGTQWVVSANIPMYLRATKASEDVEFLGWYDQYGRLVTTELEYSMLAKEDATYTARFRKFLDIDGWQIEYRTQPGKDVVTTKLANGVKPVAGKKYYIYADTYYNGAYVNRYLYNNSGTLALNTSVGDANYMWLCSVDGENYTFQNVADPTKYLKHKGIQNSPYNFKLGTGTISHEGITIYSVNDSRYLVTKNDGSVFDQATGTFNQSNGDWNTDYVFTEVSTPDVVILTNIRKSGDHDLVIPETVTILGEQLKIVGFDNNLFKNNKDLWSISLPSTIEQLSDNKVFTGAVKGKGANASANTANYITTDLGVTCAAGEDWSISLTITDNGNNFNQWGSALIATGNAPMNSTYAKGFQLYMQAGGGLVVKTDVDGDGNKLTNLAKGTKYRIDIVYTHSNTKLVVTATPLGAASAAAARTGVARAAAASLEITQDMSDFSVVSHAIPEGVDITSLEVTKGPVPDPFEGCTNLLGIEVADGCESYYVQDRTLYSTGGTDLHTLADEEKAEEIRALGELIDLAEALIAEVATSVDPTGKATEITLTTTQGNDYYIWCNNPHTSGNDGAGGVAALLDEDAGTYLHSNWSSLSSTHDYLQIDFGNAVGLDNFKIAGQQRNSGSDDRPKNIEIYGSNDGTNWTPITTVEGLPDTAGATWESGAISAAERYSHLKFIVKTHDNYNQTSSVNRPYFHMAKFDLLKLTSSAEVAPKYANLAGLKAADVEGVYDSMAEALYYYNNSGTADELAAAYNALEPLYTALNAKKDKVFNGVYHVKLGGKPLFVAYTATTVPGMDNDAAGYHLFDATTDNTSDANKELQNTAITNMAAADALFTIVPKDDNSGYTLSAQGLYLHSTRNGGWAPQLLSNDTAQAGVYLFEETETDIYKIKSNLNDIQYMNDWGAVIGNDKSNKPELSTFTLSQVTEYTLNVPEGGVTTLCLPFNVELPAGVTAYDLPKANVVKGDGYSTYELVEVAAAGEILAKNTPVIIKAAANDYTLTITMNDEGAKVSDENSVLRSGLVKTTVAAGYNYTFDGVDFNLVAADTEIAANQCWMELDENVGEVVYKTVFNGVYNIVYNGKPVFIAYSESPVSQQGPGYELYDGTTENGNPTSQEYEDAQTKAINGMKPADALIIIAPNGESTGYTLSVQGLYMKTTKPGDWASQSFDSNEEQAGVYLFEEVETGVYKLKSNAQNIQYVYDWGHVFGNNEVNEGVVSTYEIVPVTEYTLNVPANGVTTLCLPFNVVLPAGVTAYDLAKANITTKAGKYSTYELVQVATENETLAKNTPVIIKADTNDYTLTITMDGEGAKASVENSVLRSGLVKTTVAAGNNYTFDGVDFNLVAADTEVAANQCWMELDENLGAKVYGTAPDYVLTTDEENPVLYKIQINRNFDAPNASVLEYNANTGGVNVRADAADKSWQAWYFMAGNDGAVLIKPYNGDGKVLGADDNEDGHSKVWAVENGTKTICEWTIEKNGDWYNILGNGKCFSNHSGVTYKTMGFYDDKNDNGSQFKFVEAVFTDDNARYYQLKDVKATMETIYCGESVGLYSTESVTAYREELAEAQTLIDATSATSASADCYAAYKALRTADEALVYNAPAADKVYYIISTASNSYCAGKYVHTYSEPHEHKNATWGDKDYDQRHLLFDDKADISQLSLAAFQFEETGTQGEYKMKNLHTGLYAKSFEKNAEHLGAEGGIVKIAAIADGQVTLKIGNNNPMHAQNDYSVIVSWTAEANNASTWTINEVPQEDLNKIYTLAVPESGVTTLNLAFNVQLPEGVTAYDFVEGDIEQAEGSDRYEFNLTEVATAGEVLAKNTPVIIKANAGNYNLKVTFSDDNVKNGTAGSVLRGNYWQTTVGTAEANYLPGVDGRNFLFNYVATDDTPVDANTVWMTLAEKSGDIIYDNAEPAPEFTLPEVGKTYRIKSYVSKVVAEYQNHYIVNSTTGLTFSTAVAAEGKADMWVCTGADDGNFTFASALGTAALGWKAATEDAVEFTITGGYENGAVTLNNNGKNLALMIDNAGNATFSEADNKTQSTGWSTDWYLEEVENAAVSFTTSIANGNLWATMYLPYAVEIPQGVEVYVASGIDNENKVVNLIPVETNIPKNTAVLLHRSNVNETTTLNLAFDLADEDVAAVGSNLFQGKIKRTAIPAADARVYLLVKYNGNEKFYWMKDEYDENCSLVPGGGTGGYVKCDANKAYLRIEEGAKSSSFSFSYEGTTGVEEVKGENGKVKAVYDLQGRKITEITKPGFYIVDGEKVLVK